MKRHMALTVLSLLSVLATGCYTDTRLGAGSRYENLLERGEAESVEFSNQNYSISRAWLEGDMGEEGVDFAGTAYQIEVRGRNVTIHTGRMSGAEHGWVMARLEFANRSDLLGDAWAPGSIHTINRGSSEGDIRDVVGCSGPRHGNFTFDQHPPDVEIVVSEGPNEEAREFEFVLEFANGEITHGGFTVAPTDAPY